MVSNYSKHLFITASLAQLVERVTRNDKAASSILAAGSHLPPVLAGGIFMRISLQSTDFCLYSI